MNKSAETKTAINENMNSTPNRQVLDAEAARRMVGKCTDYNAPRNDSRNFKCVEISGMKFKDEDLSGIAAHYSKFKDCEFEACNISRIEGYFAEFQNCSFKNCDFDNSNLSFATISNVTFTNCNLDGVDMPFAKGDFTCDNCMMERFTAQSAELKLKLNETNSRGLEANAATLELEVTKCNLRFAEFNDGTVKGTISQTDLSRAELNRSDLTELQVIDCAVNGLETEDAAGFDNSTEEDLDDIFGDDNE
ncbi:MAG: hypothetical protein E7055_17685 [Lentisphaerae bacterium]|nr:hypothetical protein [Lentisphaerota bacterium]